MRIKAVLSFILISFCITSKSQAQTGGLMNSNIPVSTKWLLDVAGDAGRTAVKSVYMIACPKTGLKGTGFLLKSGHLITNEHVIRGCQANEIMAWSSFGVQVTFQRLIVDAKRDLAVLTPVEKQPGGLTLGTDENLLVGTSVFTWGFPLGYNGPAPLFSAGYLSGFIAYRKDADGTNVIKHLVVNGAFNPGNSGGPLFSPNNKVIGIVVSKHAPISEFHLSAIKALPENQSGITFTATDDKGKQTVLVESQVVAGLLQYFRDLTQVMIGEAISVSELKTLLQENKITLPE
ncbi:MAG: hypothetical protein COX46_03230 [bacterium (Candidatus Ratteibacteria) CG23_combo_of_CG06-09_8_20_14_all_48_7]|uniref:Serine protease n=1 Tax=bacterium (Candidatus Ratteibacteria) CG23_combo_of_CG06-09_8_20_14_all_48_7 TaxID=2014292 RepID=A0A2G9YAM2_9BACT|nr:MAG: hypothetical protein COX46_03230 [bacterium (Candidatus Ratteibacteria) CG23_combo_of_CG06-09_8_20_14_all_48_7]